MNIATKEIDFNQIPRFLQPYIMRMIVSGYMPNQEQFDTIIKLICTDEDFPIKNFLKKLDEDLYFAELYMYAKALLPLGTHIDNKVKTEIIGENVNGSIDYDLYDGNLLKYIKSFYTKDALFGFDGRLTSAVHCYQINRAKLVVDMAFDINAYCKEDIDLRCIKFIRDGKESEVYTVMRPKEYVLTHFLYLMKKGFYYETFYNKHSQVLEILSDPKKFKNIDLFNIRISEDTTLANLKYNSIKTDYGFSLQLEYYVNIEREYWIESEKFSLCTDKNNKHLVSTFYQQLYGIMHP